MNESMENWEDLLEQLKKLTPEELKQPIQAVDYESDEDSVSVCKIGICFARVKELEFKYIRSVDDNRKHPEHFVLLLDANPFDPNGAIAYKWEEGKEEVPIFQKQHDDSADWTGPAQKLIDQTINE